MTDVLFTTMLALAVPVGWIGIHRLNRSVRHTSLTAAIAWAAWFQVTLTVTAIATLVKTRVQLGLLDQLWYLTAVSALCPFVAVLGARRGRLVEWSLFIVLPLLIVLEWPALAQFTHCWNGQRLELEIPTLVVFAVVLVMAIGHFFDTRFNFAALCWMTTWGLVAWSLRASTASTSIAREANQRIAVLFLLQFWLSLGFLGRRRTEADHDWNRVWCDFRNLFGNVWALRLMARVNQIARRENWPWLMTEKGLASVDSQNSPTGNPSNDSRVDQTLRWLLKPFVDPEWIDERLRASTDRALGG